MNVTKTKGLKYVHTTLFPPPMNQGFEKSGKLSMPHIVCDIENAAYHMVYDIRYVTHYRDRNFIGWRLVGFFVSFFVISDFAEMSFLSLQSGATFTTVGCSSLHN